MRILSLLPATTEIVCALGRRASLVGRSHECDFPEDVRDLPSPSAPRLDPHAPSRAIDDRVTELLSRALSIYEIDPEKLRALAPDLIITQTLCAVCAASEDDVRAALETFPAPKPRLLSVSASSLEGVWRDIATIAQAIDAIPAGEALLASLRQRVEALSEAARLLPKRRVACIEWIDPLMSAGNWVPELVARAGGENLFGHAGEGSPWCSWESITAADPEVLLVFPCGFDLARGLDETRALCGLPGWSGLRAVQEKRVYVIDGNQYLNRPGPRLVESLEIIAEALHPEHFSFQHPGWAPFF
jgi:iron complex transport system substrate-binding protein